MVQNEICQHLCECGKITFIYKKDIMDAGIYTYECECGKKNSANKVDYE